MMKMSKNRVSLYRGDMGAIAGHITHMMRAASQTQRSDAMYVTWNRHNGLEPFSVASCIMIMWLRLTLVNLSRVKSNYLKAFFSILRPKLPNGVTMPLYFTA